MLLNNPLNWTDLFGLEPGASYSSMDDAGVAAIREINRKSIQENHEYAGTIYKKDDGSSTYTEPDRGLKNHAAPSFPPEVKEVQADYHTHGAESAGYHDEIFSRGDKETNSGSFYGKPVAGYLGTSCGRMKKYTPGEGVEVLACPK